MFRCSNLPYLLSMDIEHGAELIDSFLESEADKELRSVFFFANPNGYNTEMDYKAFKNTLTVAKEPSKSLEVIMSEVKNILEQFSPEVTSVGDI